MKKILSSLLIVTIILSASLISCKNEDVCDYKGINGCICMIRNSSGEALCTCSRATHKNPIQDIMMYPNPASSHVSLTFNTWETRTIIIKNRWGKEMLSQTINYGNLMIDINDYPEGTYLVTVDDGNKKSKHCLFKVK